MTRLRWSIGALLIALALISAVRALSAYLGHQLWLGSAAVITLAVVAVLGFHGLWRARQRIARELEGLAADPPTGELWRAREARVRAIREAGAPLDTDALAAATEAEERGRAYLGRYLVAVSVLVGLVGTFAGLIETLHAVGPLLRDEHVTTLAMLAAPLGGLDVTFGASVVGILVTLALALVQGDLVLAEELALSRLEERTVHRLVPSLWPRAEAADERAARELAALRGELGQLLARAGETAAERVAGVAGGAVERLVENVAARLDGATHATDELRAETMRLVAAQRESLAEAAAQAQAATRALVDRVTAAEAQSTERLAQLHADTAARIERLHAESSAQLVAAERAAAETLAARIAESHAAATAALTETQSAATAALTRTQAEATASLTRAQNDAVSTLTQAQKDAAAALTQAQAGATTAMTQAQKEATAALVQAQKDAAEAMTRAQREAAERLETLERALVDDLAAAQRDAATQLSELSLRGNERLSESHRELAARAEAALVELARVQGERWSALAGAVEEQLRGAIGGAGERFDGATAALGTAATELRAGAERLGPALDALAPELQALAKEVALLAAKSDAPEDTLVADELVRLGEGVERLESLLRLSRGHVNEREGA